MNTHNVCSYSIFYICMKKHQCIPGLPESWIAAVRGRELERDRHTFQNAVWRGVGLFRSFCSKEISSFQMGTIFSGSSSTSSIYIRVMTLYSSNDIYAIFIVGLSESPYQLVINPPLGSFDPDRSS